MTQRFYSKSSLTLMGATVFAFSAGYSLEAHAQDRSSTGKDRPWEIVASFGLPFGGPADDIEEGMRASGWDDTEPTFDVEHPFSTGGELSWAVSARRSLRPRLEVELLTTRSNTGSTNGSQGFFHFLFLNHSVTTIAPIASLRLGAWHIGAGPTVNRVRLERSEVGEAGQGSKEEWKVGVLADTGITFPRRSKLFFEGRGQYRWIPGTEVGPFTSVTGFPDDTRDHAGRRYRHEPRLPVGRVGGALLIA